MTALTKTKIDAELARCARERTRVELVDHGEPGLRLRVGERGAKWSVLLRQTSGDRVRVPLGPWPDVGLKAARDAARETKRKAREGETVSAAERREAAREAERQRVVTRTLLDEFEAQRLVNLRAGAGARRGIELLLDEYLDRVPAELTRSVFARLVDARAKAAPVAANRSIAYVRPFLKWLVTRGYLGENPAVGFEKPTKEKPRERTPDLAEVAEIWRAAGRLGYPFGAYTRLVILTTGRRDEVAGMRLDELDLDAPGGATWTLGSERMKNRRETVVPLAPEAVAIIRDAAGRRPNGSPFVFSTVPSAPISGFSQLKRALDREIEKARIEIATAEGREPEGMVAWTLHDLRRSFATIAIDVLHLDPVTVDRCLNHAAAGTTTVVQRTYARTQMIAQRRAALDAWARFVTGAVEVRQEAGNVIALRPRT